MKKYLITASAIATFFTMSALADTVTAVCTNLTSDGLQIRYTLLKNNEGHYRLLKESYGYNSDNEQTRSIEFLHERLKCSIQPDFSFACENIYMYCDYSNASSTFVMSKEANAPTYSLELSSSWRQYRTGITHYTKSFDTGLICRKGSI